MILPRGMITTHRMSPSLINFLMTTKMLEVGVRLRLKEFHNYHLPNRARRNLTPIVMDVVELATLC